MAFWAIALAALGGLAVLMVAALCVPVDATVRWNVSGKPRLQFKLSWLGGRLHTEIRGKKKAARDEVAVRTKPSRGLRGLRKMFRVMSTGGLARQALVLLRDIFRRIKFSDLSGNVRFGLGDPADTGVLFGLVSAVLSFLRPAVKRDVVIRPDFEDAVLDGYLSGTVTLRPIGLVPPVLRFVLSPAVLRAFIRSRR